VRVQIDGVDYVPQRECPKGQPIGEAFRALRESSRETLDEVAKAAGISRAYLWEIEAGEAVDPSFRLVASLAKHYGVSLDELAKGV
jgi:transcriptional regulator with XRE-family HTH domain